MKWPRICLTNTPHIITPSTRKWLGILVVRGCTEQNLKLCLL
jgi:hypothetical protein